MILVIQDSQIAVGNPKHPVRPYQLGNENVIPLKFLTDTVKEQIICILGIHDTCTQRRCYQTVASQTVGTFCLYNRLIILSGIDCNKVVFKGIDYRMNSNAFQNFIRKLFSANGTKRR